MPRLSHILPCLTLLLTLPLAGCLDSKPKVTCVDVERVLTQSRAAGQANEHLKKVQDVLQNGLNAYEKELKKSAGRSCARASPCCSGSWKWSVWRPVMWSASTC